MSSDSSETARSSKIRKCLKGCAITIASLMAVIIGLFVVTAILDGFGIIDLETTPRPNRSNSPTSTTIPVIVLRATDTPNPAPVPTAMPTNIPPPTESPRPTPPPTSTPTPKPTATPFPTSTPWPDRDACLDLNEIVDNWIAGVGSGDAEEFLDKLAAIRDRLSRGSDARRAMNSFLDTTRSNRQVSNYEFESKFNAALIACELSPLP